MEILILFPIFFITYIFAKHVLFKYQNEPENFPPGPRSYLPLIGGFSKVGLEPYKIFLNMRKDWGDIFAFDLGPKRVVIFNNYKSIKEAFAKIEFNGRDQSIAFRLKQPDFVQNGILLNTANQAWLDLRRFTMKNLSNLEIGKDTIENILENEVLDLIEKFRNPSNGKFVITNDLQLSMLCIISTIIAGRRFDPNDPQVVKLLKSITENVNSGMLLHFYPWLFKLYEIFPFGFGFVKKYIENCQFELDFVQKIIDQNKLEFQENFQNNLIDKYLIKIKNETNPNSNFFGVHGDRNLKSVINELFSAGLETTSTVLNWMIHLLAINPKIQEKVYQEIKSIIGLNRRPTLSDKPLLIYTEACILETLRYSAMLPATIHETMEDIKNFHGYDFPKGTTIFINFHACLHDPKVWKNPDEFQPERFLTQDETKIIKNEAFIPFFTGKRVCLGETLARDSLFIFTTSIFQRFKIYPHPGLTKIPEKIHYIIGATKVPISFPLIFQDRFE